MAVFVCNRNIERQPFIVVQYHEVFNIQRPVISRAILA
jgi:hypothetical protein